MNQFIPPIFPKLQHYRGEADLLHSIRRVVCLEKIDGTNTRIGVPRGAQSPQALSIGGRDLMEWEPGFSQPFLPELLRKDVSLCNRLLALSAQLQQDLVLYGETCGGKIQSMGYLYGPKPHFLLFAAMIGGVWLSYRASLTLPFQEEASSKPRALPSLTQLSEQLKLTLAPCVYEGAPDAERLAALIERPSAHALQQGFARQDVENLQEGIVLWADPLLLDPFGQPVACKWKHPRRRETIEVSEEMSQTESPQDFAARVVLAERLHHAISALQESGRWTTQAAQNQEALIRRVIQDVSKEVPAYQTQLARSGKKEVRAALEAQIIEVFAALPTQ